MDTGESVMNGMSEMKQQPNAGIPIDLFKRVYIWNGQKFILATCTSDESKEFIRPKNSSPEM